jgi:hypothetical protein
MKDRTTMRRSTRVALTVATVTTATAALPLATATPGAAATPVVGLVVPVLAPMLPGQSGWVSALWGTTGDICDVRATARGAGLTVSYPANTGDHSSLYKEDALDAGHFDYTAFKLALDPDTKLATSLSITFAYSDCHGTTKTVTAAAVLPVVAATGAAVVQKTASVAVPKSTPVWTQLSFQGRKTGLAGFRVTLSPPSGLTVAYPGDKTSAGLALATSLPVGSDDFVAVRIDATGAAAGTYKVPVHATYDGGRFDSSLTVVVS